MDIEKLLHFPERSYGGKDVAMRCRKLAKVLSSGRWKSDDVRRVDTSRSFTEALGMPPTVSKALGIPDMWIETTAEFTAEKEIIDTDEKTGTPVLEEVYTISVSVGEPLSKNELPPFILEQLQEYVVVRQSDDSEDEEIGAIDLLDDAEQTEISDSFVFTRDVEMGYVISEDGEINDFALIYTYLVDDKEIDSIKYSWSDMQNEFQINSFKSGSGEAHLTAPPTLSTKDINDFIEHFDEIMLGVSEQSQFDAIQDDYEIGMHLPEAEHCRRIMGMLAIVSAGLRRAPRFRKMKFN